MSIKNSNGTIGNRARDLPVCSAVSQPTAPPTAYPFSFKVRPRKQASIYAVDSSSYENLDPYLGRFIPTDRAPGTKCVVPAVCLDVVEKGCLLVINYNPNQDYQIFHPIA
jgi:hypothetical protein